MNLQENLTGKELGGIVIRYEYYNGDFMAISKLHPVAFGASSGLIFGVSVLLLSFFAYYFLNGKPIILELGTMYLAYNSSPINSALCGVVAGLNGFVGGYIFSWIYNLLIDIL